MRRITLRAKGQVTLPEEIRNAARLEEGDGGRDRRRSGDLPLFRRTLCQLSYSTVWRRVGTHGESESVSTLCRPIR
jgi:hypothetical protein